MGEKIILDFYLLLALPTHPETLRLTKYFAHGESSTID